MIEYYNLSKKYTYVNSNINYDISVAIKYIYNNVNIYGIINDKTNYIYKYIYFLHNKLFTLNKYFINGDFSLDIFININNNKILLHDWNAVSYSTLEKEFSTFIVNSYFYIKKNA